MKKAILGIFLFMFVCKTLAGVHCGETITGAILHKNGNVYFTTSKTCPNWCQIKWETEADKNRAYSTFLAAKTADRSITIYWPDLENCDQDNVTYASPDYMSY